MQGLQAGQSLSSSTRHATSYDHHLRQQQFRNHALAPVNWLLASDSVARAVSLCISEGMRPADNERTRKHK